MDLVNSPEGAVHKGRFVPRSPPGQEARVATHPATQAWSNFPEEVPGKGISELA